MRPELIDHTRRVLRQDIGERVAAAGLDDALGELVAGDVHELLDALLIAFELAELSRHDRAAAGAFVFADAWPVILRHMLPLSCKSRGGNSRAAERLSLALSREAADA